jgi:hypothetical protein
MNKCFCGDWPMFKYPECGRSGLCTKAPVSIVVIYKDERYVLIKWKIPNEINFFVLNNEKGMRI